MVKIIVAGGFLLSVFIFPLYINAQEDSASPAGRTRLRDIVQDRVEDVQNRRAEIEEQMRVKKEEFRQRLLTIRDQAKRTVLGRIDTRMASVNQKITDRFSSVLDKLQSILNRFSQRAQIAKSEGKDTDNLDAAITSAQLSIDNAKGAVASQAANIYVIEIASESALRNDVGEVVSQLQTDLRNLHQLVINAKQAVQNVVMELARLTGIGLEEESTAASSLEQ